MFAAAFFGQTYFAGAPEDSDITVAPGDFGRDAPSTRYGVSSPSFRGGRSTPSTEGAE